MSVIAFCIGAVFGAVVGIGFVITMVLLITEGGRREDASERGRKK